MGIGSGEKQSGYAHLLAYEKTGRGGGGGAHVENNLLLDEFCPSLVLPLFVGVLFNC